MLILKNFLILLCLLPSFCALNDDQSAGLGSRIVDSLAQPIVASDAFKLFQVHASEDATMPPLVSDSIVSSKSTDERSIVGRESWPIFTRITDAEEKEWRERNEEVVVYEGDPILIGKPGSKGNGKKSRASNQNGKSHRLCSECVNDALGKDRISKALIKSRGKRVSNKM